MTCNIIIQRNTRVYRGIQRNNNRLLTEREGRTGEYWPKVVAVRPEQARLVSCLLYGTLFLIVKCTSGAINLFSFLSFSFLSF